MIGVGGVVGDEGAVMSTITLSVAAKNFSNPPLL
jgi:hypothetical protein